MSVHIGLLACFLCAAYVGLLGIVDFLFLLVYVRICGFVGLSLDCFLRFCGFVGFVLLLVFCAFCGFVGFDRFWFCLFLSHGVFKEY